VSEESNIPKPSLDGDGFAVYHATITPDGQVTAAGRVASCMGCHEVATHERLFGVPLSPTLGNWRIGRPISRRR